MIIIIIKTIIIIVINIGLDTIRLVLFELSVGEGVISMITMIM